MTEHDDMPATGAALDRRAFLSAAGALVVGASLTLSAREALAAGAAGGAVGAYVRIDAAGRVTVLIGSSEMGQGIMTGLCQVVAEELKVEWSMVRGRHAPAAAAYANPMFRMQLTGGSTSMRGWFHPLRKAAAAAREMLVTAGADAMGVPRSTCHAAGGRVVSSVGGRSVGYAEIAAAAGRLTPPEDPPLTPDSELRYIGRSMKRVDVRAKTDGSAVFGIDVRLPGMLYAAVRHGPVFGATVRGTPRRPSGAVAVVNLGNAIAAVSARDTWHAMGLARNARVSWSRPTAAAAIDSDVIGDRAADLLATGKAVVAEEEGVPDGALAGAAKTIDATFEVPFLAHACLEPLNCTAHVTADRCEIWAPTQGQGLAVFTAMAATGLPAERIVVHTTFLGGGLGRKFEQDFIRQAILTSKAVGKPVKLTWPRSEDFGNDQYRPLAAVRIRAGLDDAGRLSAWIVRSTSPSIAAQRNPAFAGVDSSAVEGTVDLAYDIPNRRTEWLRLDAGVPVGYWRSVGHSFNAFAVECAIDELCAVGGHDPVAFRLGLLKDDPRARAVLSAAAELAGWGSPPPAGRQRGVAYHESFGSRVAEIVEASLDEATGRVRIHEVACAIDCGIVVNPNQVRAQMEGGILHGLSTALWHRMTFDGGRAVQRNFGAYRSLRMRDAPRIRVKVIAGGAPIGGVGEPGVPPAAPALVNALSRLKGRRIRALPLYPIGGSGTED